jgi:hypothetical protein
MTAARRRPAMWVLPGLRVSDLHAVMHAGPRTCAAAVGGCIGFHAQLELKLQGGLRGDA